MSLQSLIASGTKVWLDSIDPDLVASNRKWGATGATSNPIIISDLIKTGRFDARIDTLSGEGRSDEEIAWAMTDKLVRDAQAVFKPVWEQTQGNDGYVSFELDPLLEDVNAPTPHADAVARYIELGKKWGVGHQNRMIKVPATPAGARRARRAGGGGIDAQRDAHFLRAAIQNRPRQRVARRPAAGQRARRLQKRLFDLRQPGRCLHRQAPARPFARRPGHGGHRQCETALEREPAVLGVEKPQA